MAFALTWAAVIIVLFVVGTASLSSDITLPSYAGDFSFPPAIFLLIGVTTDLRGARRHQALRGARVYLAMALACGFVQLLFDSRRGDAFAHPWSYVFYWLVPGVLLILLGSRGIQAWGRCDESATVVIDRL